MGTCSHLKKHGCVLRCQRMCVHAKHIKNKGGAVATRDGSGKKERMNIAILQKKWPGVFKLNAKRKDEVLMHWGQRGTSQADPGDSGKQHVKERNTDGKEPAS